MTRREEATAVARYLVFESLEALLALATVALSLGLDAVGLYLMRASQETWLLQEIAPGFSQFALLAFMALFRLAWYGVFYLWRRRAGLWRLMGQLLVLLPPAAGAALWLALTWEAARMYESAFFIAVPCTFALSALGAVALAACPVRALIRYRRAQVEAARALRAQS